MSQIASHELRQASPAPHPRSLHERFRSLCADFWLNYFFFFCDHLPALVRPLKNFHLFFACRHSRVIKTATRLNAGRILGPDTPPPERRQFTREVVSNFFDFVHDVGRARRMSRDQILSLIESVDGHEHYEAARAAGRGAIVVTAHMGSFEAGIAALLEHERDIHVVFKRDLRGRFEQIRQSLRQRLGVHEAAIDDGWTIWMRLRDALLANQVVVLQADRVMPGQKGQPVPFLHGHLLLPTGPLKLALASGAPLLPIFTTRTPAGKIRIHIEPAIWVDPAAAATTTDAVHPALLSIASVLEKYVRAYPEQWLVLQPAFCEDAAPLPPPTPQPQRAEAAAA